jgi:hypothetical protein
MEWNPLSERYSNVFYMFDATRTNPTIQEDHVITIFVLTPCPCLAIAVLDQTFGRLTTIRGAGHWVHAEAPDDTLALLKRFLDR